MIIKISDFNLRHRNTLRMDVTCSTYVEYDNPTDLHSIMSELQGQRWIHIGAGSNLLFIGNYEGTVLSSKILDVEMKHAGSGDVTIRVGAGVEMDALAEQTCSAGLWGLENLSGIPGEAGAAAVQNVGAYGVEACQVIESIECYDTVERRFVIFQPERCDYGYRTSLFKQSSTKGRFVITHVVFRLSSNPNPRLDYGHLRERLNSNADITPSEVRKAIITMRNEKLPDVTEVGSAGSFFKNPVITLDEYSALLTRVESVTGKDIIPPHYNVDNDMIKIPAAWLIEKSGLKGFRMEGAATWSRQPLVIVNISGNATPREIVALENKIVETVRDTFGITLSPEVEHVM